MSHSFHIENVNKIPYQDTLNNLGIENLLFTEDSPAAENNTWPLDVAYLYADNVSVRPVETTYTGNTFIARIFANSSPEDYRLAIKLISEIAVKNNALVAPEDNEAMDVEIFLKYYDDKWIEQHCQTMFEMLVGSYKKEQTTYKMTGTMRELQAGPRFFNQLLAKPDDAAAEFYRRFKTLNYLENQDVYIANGIRMQNEQGDKEIVISVYGPGVPTVLSDSVDAIRLHCDGEEECVVKIEQLADALGHRAVWLGENVLLAPEINNGVWNELVESLKPAAQADLFDLGRPVDASQQLANQQDDIEDYKALFSDDEWRNLLYSPILIFGLVAGADGTIDKKEVASFQQQLLKGLIVENKLIQQIMLDLIPNAVQLLKDVLEGSVDPKSSLEMIRDVVDARLSNTDAIHFKIALLQIGQEIAESSGGFLGMFGSKVSKEEEQALAALIVLLGVASQ